MGIFLFFVWLLWKAAVIIALCIYLTVSLANVFASAMLIVGTVKVSKVSIIDFGSATDTNLNGRINKEKAVNILRKAEH